MKMKRKKKKMMKKKRMKKKRMKRKSQQMKSQQMRSMSPVGPPFQAIPSPVPPARECKLNCVKLQ